MITFEVGGVKQVSGGLLDAMFGKTGGDLRQQQPKVGVKGFEPPTLLPKQVRYQAVPHPEVVCLSLFAGRFQIV